MKTTETDVAIAKYGENIQQIHKQFDSATNQLLDQANKIINEDNKVEKAMRLKDAGFGKAKEVRENETSIKIRTLAEQTAKIVDYYSRKYPLYKYITMAQVMDIAKKYDLVLGKTSDYMGFIPEKNLTEIENFKIEESDKEKNSEMQIVAPLKDMDTYGKRVIGRKIIEDPIVLQPVLYGMLIVTKWGDEASDPIVMNPIEN